MCTSGRYRPGKDKPDPKTWKANFRCALNSLPDICELQEHSRKRGNNAYRVYRMLPSTHAHRRRRGGTNCWKWIHATCTCLRLSLITLSSWLVWWVVARVWWMLSSLRAAVVQQASGQTVKSRWWACGLLPDAHLAALHTSICIGRATQSGDPCRRHVWYLPNARWDTWLWNLCVAFGAAACGAWRQLVLVVQGCGRPNLRSRSRTTLSSRYQTFTIKTGGRGQCWPNTSVDSLTARKNLWHPHKQPHPDRTKPLCYQRSQSQTDWL